MGGSFGCTSKTYGGGVGGGQAPFPGAELVEATVGELRAGTEIGRWTSRELTALYLARIQAFEQATKHRQPPSYLTRSTNLLP